VRRALSSASGRSNVRADDLVAERQEASWPSKPRSSSSTDEITC
jgi:hypothetical protein